MFHTEVSRDPPAPTTPISISQHLHSYTPTLFEVTNACQDPPPYNPEGNPGAASILQTSSMLLKVVTDLQLYTAFMVVS